MRNEFYNYEWNYKNKNKKVVYSTIGSVNYKGLETIAECGLKLNKSNGIDVDLRIGGILSQDEVFKIVSKKYGKDIKNFIKPLGSIPASVVVKEMLSSDVFVHPSHIDNSPNSVCEAMMLGIPVVSTDVGGIPSLIENGVDGLLVPSGNANLMTEAILRIMNDQVLANKLSKNARKRALERHDKAKIVNDLFSIYKSLISSNLQ